MQSITVLAYIEAPPTLRASGDTQTAAFTAQVAAYKHDEPPMLLAATIWGSAADRAAANIRADSHWILSGYFRIEKNQPLEFKVQKFYAVSPPWIPASIPSPWSAALAATLKPATSSRAPWLQTSPWP
jgi:hypothetical protein